MLHHILQIMYPHRKHNSTYIGNIILKISLNYRRKRLKLNRNVGNSELNLINSKMNLKQIIKGRLGTQGI